MAGGLPVACAHRPPNNTQVESTRPKPSKIWIPSMTLFKSLLLALICIPTFSDLIVAQDDMADQVEARIKEVESMIDEELSTIAVLERQQAEAMDAKDSDRVAQLKTEIDAANRSLGKLEGLKEQLDDLKRSNDRKRANTMPRSSRPRDLRNKKRPSMPTIGGNESGMDLARETDRIRRKEERNAAQDLRNDWTTAPPNRGASPPTRNSNRRSESFRVRNLRIAYDALLDSGENELAQQVQSLIERESRSSDAGGQARNRPSRPTAGGMNRGQFSNRNNGPGMADGPTTADGPLGGRRGNQRAPQRPQNNPPVAGNQPGPDSQRELDAMEDEIERLRDKLRALREREKGDN